VYFLKSVNSAIYGGFCFLEGGNSPKFPDLEIENINK
jgi:hypothetical protein